jgi:hypothetical protein
MAVAVILVPKSVPKMGKTGGLDNQSEIQMSAKNSL